MRDVIDLNRYPLDQPGSPAWLTLVEACKSKLAEDGLFNLPGFVRQAALREAVTAFKPILAKNAFLHRRRHNIYFKRSVDGLPDTHPALQTFETSNKTICADQMDQAVVIRLYEWPPFARFLAAVMGKTELFAMADPLARVNVMSYSEGEALNWHFDRSEFTTTLLLQAPEAGGDFEYDKDLRSDSDPNYEGVADLLQGRRSPTLMRVTPGTLNIFKGKNTAHRVTPVKGASDRIIAVFSYYDRPGVQFSADERIGFYGRAS
ncbi:2OG-Fe(II) oxygenase family protein [Roseobacter ponti]|uniref:2OG-Fe(II) oxygenase n=1 Tax=Roseobacter ponti TaxID=1891787 RepID=A0A858SX51_9RHOB|nr:2OG-Fe(II) oxygenase family protein [Roseobacter ponti]QJF52588.1 2OG-Fe(II) oxygenase [Roseobacter ponti]